MKTKHIAPSLVALLVLALLPAALSAEPARGRGRMARAAGLAALELTAEQRGKMDELRVGHVKETAPVRAELKVKQAELSALWRAEQLDARSIIAKVREIAGLRERLAVARANHRLAVHGLLTPEQREAFDGFRGPGRGGRDRRGGGRNLNRAHGCRGDCDDCHGHEPSPGE